MAKRSREFMPKRIIVSLFLALLIVSCSKKFGMQRETLFTDRASVEIRDKKCATARAGDITVSLQIIAPGDWEKLFVYELFSSEKKANPRLPAAPFYHLVIANTGDRPLPLDGISLSLRYGGTEMKAIKAEEAEKAYASPAFSIFNFKQILSPKRLLTDRTCIDDIGYGNDLIDYRLDFINPGERVLLIASFGWIPVEAREYTVRIDSRDGESKKSIDFELRRFEYRTRGGRFRKPDASRQEILP
jgi:hypothetical protein